MKHVAVLMGGWSAERAVSLNSGRGCADALESMGYRVTRVDVDRSIAETLARLRPDVAFNALHGRFGEDGTIQGVLEILAHSLHPFRRARLGAGGAEGPREDRPRRRPAFPSPMALRSIATRRRAAMRWSRPMCSSPSTKARRSAS